jgi:hypothetical protein
MYFSAKVNRTLGINEQQRSSRASGLASRGGGSSGFPRLARGAA